MPVWPKSFYTFGLSMRTAATEWKLRQKRGAIAQQERAFRALIAPLARSSHWREAGLERNCTYSVFQSRIAPRDAARLAPAVERMMKGEADVLWPGACNLFLATPGMSDGVKHLPVTEALLRHLRQAGLQSLLYYTVRARDAGVLRGRHLWVGSHLPVRRMTAPEMQPTYVADAGGLAKLGLPAWLEKHHYEPAMPAPGGDDWSAQIDAVAAHACRVDISLLAALPPWAILLARSLRSGCTTGGRPIAHLQELWPNLECFVHTGVPIAPFADELREALGPTVRFHEVYAASEAFVAVQDGEPTMGLRLLADCGVFFEFLPLADFDAARLDQLGPKLVPLAGVKPGINYVLFITTPGGLVRYPLGDVVRFLSIAPPRLTYVGRTALRLDAFGEIVNEKELTDSLAAVCQRNGWKVVNFHVAPQMAPSLTGTKRGHYEWWIELNAGSVATPRGPHLAEELDAELQRTSPDYAAKRRVGTLGAPIVRLVMPGVFEHWLRFHRRWGGQHKTPRCRSDRAIADELAQITNFAGD